MSRVRNEVGLRVIKGNKKWPEKINIFSRPFMLLLQLLIKKEPLLFYPY